MSTTLTIPVLPVEAYTSQDWFEVEQRVIFSQTWQFAGLIEDLAEPGDYLTVQAGQNNIVVLCDRDRQLRAFHNICRHRGTPLLRAAGRIHGAITCPYHNWMYSFEGTLIGVPQKSTQFPETDLRQLCLHHASVETWRGMIFTHSDSHAEPLTRWFTGVEEYLGPHQPEELVEDESARTRHEINANWKVVVENYIDGYHLSHLHSDTLSMYNHKKIESGFVGPHFVFYQPLAKDYLDSIETKTRLSVGDHIPTEQLGAYVPLLFPNLGLAETEADWSIFHIIPLTPEKTLVKTRSKLIPVSPWAYTKRQWASWEYCQSQGQKPSNTQNEQDPLASGDFMAEDIFICEQLQSALRSPYFAVSATAKDLEQSIVQFQKLIKNWVESS